MFKLFRSRLVLAALLLTLPALVSAAPGTAQAAQTKAATAPKASPAPKAETAPKVDKIDINTATVDQLKAIPGIGDAYSKRIVDGRPYANKSQLLSKGILPEATYNKIKEQIIATQPKK
jgi:DNA uptake protein ComE-like DNA-binding protein